MFILTADQVTPQQAIRRHNSQVERLLAIIYRHWLFIKGESFPFEQKEFAIKHTREKLDAGQMCIIVIDAQKNYVVCYEDQELELLEHQTTGSDRRVGNLEKIIEAIRNDPNLIKNNRHKLRIYPRSILGDEMVTWLCNHLGCSRQEAVQIGQQMMDQGWLHHTWDDHDFEDEPLLYRFYQDERFSLPFITK